MANTANPRADMLKNQQCESITQIKPSLVIIGNGMATGRLLDEIIKRTPNKYQITVIGKEHFGSYNRIMLSAVLAGDATIDSIMQKPPAWYKQHNINLLSGSEVTYIDNKTKVVTLASDVQIHYDELIIATGSRTAKIPAKNQNIAGIFNFRNISDTEKIQAFAKQAGSNSKQAIVIGGGLLGLEAAYGLALSGVEVTLVHRNKWLLNRQLDKVAGFMLQSIMEQKNIKFALGHEVAAFESIIATNAEITSEDSSEILSGVRLTSGEFISAQIAVIATGITPNKELAETANIDFNRAILVNNYMQTSDAAISALGECCEHNHATFGLVDPIWAQCITLAERLCNNVQKPFQNAPVPTKLKVSGVQLFSAGDVEVSEGSQCFTLLDNKALIYRKIIVKNGKISGIVLFGDVSSGMAYFELMQQQIIVNTMMPELLIGDEFVTTIEDEQKVSIA
ncbi:NAD(P)/FAD-dependent oxidoreductase [Colwellia sp. BRX10-3]|uniref:NAD(P)/FAD-dependent oxidoreductase n=1 Tax=Colwellia sp. BRX10-3 TaxID=2759844 RepID=UPI0015F5D0CA|nr:FAD-dependent oxidoreductase [Colwellia sp. BRX10-3]MBA6390285.1 NAD(P)/FAD-dependent oxidoreductase [Colwellia sp. BRX10-3]